MTHRQRVGVLVFVGMAAAMRTTAGQNATPAPAAPAAPAGAAAPAGPAAPAARKGYLAANQTPDVSRIVPPAPTVGDARFTADMAIYRTTRSLEGTPRWKIALSDDNVSTNGLLTAFRCALGVQATAQNSPRMRALVSRATIDIVAPAGALKKQYQHKRPFQVEAGPVCLSEKGRAALEKDPDYPSGHTTAAWEVGLILAELAPDASADILARARAFGESRIVCGVHNASAVEAGRLTATAVFAAQHGSAEFRADADAAREELAALRARVTEKPAGCTDEVATLAGSPF